MSETHRQPRRITIRKSNLYSKTMRTPDTGLHADNRNSVKRFFTLLVSILLIQISAQAATVVWSGANSATDTNWSDNINWVGSVAPGNSDDAKFFDLGSAVTASNVNNIVDLGFG